MKKLNLLFSLVLLIAVAGCKSTTAPEVEMSVFGSVYVYEDGTDISFVEVGLTSSISTVTLNQDTLTYMGQNFHIGGFDYWGEHSLNYGDPIHLEVKNEGRIATASVTAPGAFGIISPDTSKVCTLSVGSDLEVSWSASNNADYYNVVFQLFYDYYDTSGIEKSFILDKDTCVPSTSITFPSIQLFPSDLDSISCIPLRPEPLRVYALNGPQLEPNSEGNVEGDGMGCFWSIVNGGKIDVMVEEGTRGRGLKLREELSQDEFMKRWLEKARKYFMFE